MGRIGLLFDVSNGRHPSGAIYLEKHAMMITCCLKRTFFKDSDEICQAIKWAEGTGCCQRRDQKMRERGEDSKREQCRQCSDCAYPSVRNEHVGITFLG